MRPKLNYIPWKITLRPGYCDQPDAEKLEIPHMTISSEPGQLQRIHDRIQSWRRFPVCYGEGVDCNSAVYVLLDRIGSPFALLDPAAAQVARAEKIRPSELPKSLRDLYDRLVQIGHASPDAGPEGGE